MNYLKEDELLLLVRSEAADVSVLQLPFEFVRGRRLHQTKTLRYLYHFQFHSQLQYWHSPPPVQQDTLIINTSHFQITLLKYTIIMIHLENMLCLREVKVMQC